MNTLLCKGGGFPAFWYTLGYGSVVYNDQKIIEGYSSGALAATIILFFDNNLEEVIKVASESYDETHIGLFGICLSDVIYKMLDKFLPIDAHIPVEGRLGIIISSLKMNGTIVRKWASRDELIDCVIASCFIPCISDFVGICDPIYKSVDGGFSMNLSELCHGKQFIESTIETSYFGQLRRISKQRAIEIFNIGRQEALTLQPQKNPEKSNLIWYFLLLIGIIIFRKQFIKAIYKSNL